MIVAFDYRSDQPPMEVEVDRVPTIGEYVALPYLQGNPGINDDTAAGEVRSVTTTLHLARAAEILVVIR